MNQNSTLFADVITEYIHLTSSLYKKLELINKLSNSIDNFEIALTSNLAMREILDVSAEIRDKVVGNLAENMNHENQT